MEGRSYKKKKPNVVNVGKDKIEPANEEDEDGLMSEEIIENEAKDKDCYRYKLFGVPMGKRDIVLSTFKGMELFLFDFDLRLMYGICKATWLEGVRKQSIDNEFYPGNAFSVNLMLKLHDGSPSSFSRMVAWVVENSLPRALGIISCICFDFNVAASCYLSAASQIDLMCLQLPLTLTVKNIINVAIASYPGRRLEGDWTTDVLTDAATRVEESVKRNSYSQPSIT
ncbi:hypothetical protein NC653_002614 [Populus alba x Populus x berolinensis]|uniref:DCD domain-containing protein n=1 Tax=Populus alba x Populus x berolinensis TaxID=444605 RepID=A0AAD6RP88_9ROSI|nr:hypothetical protein NC653_002614 [Populus alba x Populus x berolinensis]